MYIMYSMNLGNRNPDQPGAGHQLGGERDERGGAEQRPPGGQYPLHPRTHSQTTGWKMILATKLTKSPKKILGNEY